MLVPSPAAALDKLKQALAALGDVSGYATGCTSDVQGKEEKISGFKLSWHLTQSSLRSAGVPGSDLHNKQLMFPDKAKNSDFLWL